MKKLLRIYELKLQRALNNLELAKSETESIPAESEAEADYLFKIADKRLIKAQQMVEDLKEFIPDIKLYM